MRTDELIVQLARSAGPVESLARPSRRLAQWAAATAILMTLGVFALGPRADVMTAIARPAFLGIAVVTVVTGLLSAASALVLGIPGAERSRWQRIVPLMAGGVWTLALAWLLAAEGAAARRVLEWPVHWSCLAQIAGLSAVPGWGLFVMLRRSAPIEKTWSGALATLAAVAIGAAATQLICPIDDPAHQLVGHVFPVATLSILGSVAGQQYLNWMRRG